MVVREQLTQEDVDRVFHALADATRRDVVVRVLQDEHSVSDLAGHYPMSFAAVQKHVAVLERAGLVVKRRHGREQLVSGNIATIRRAAALLDELELLWRARLERFGDLLAEGDDAPPDTTAATHSTAPHSTAQHSTTQYSTTQHSTTQHSTKGTST